MNQNPPMNQMQTSQLPPPPPAPEPPAMSPQQLHADLNTIRSVLHESAAARGPHRTIIAAGNLVCALVMLIAVPIILIACSIPLFASGGEDGTGIPLVAGFLVVCLLMLLASPFLLAAWGLYKGKSWGVVAAVVASVFNLMNFPIGTALAGYTFWAMYNNKLAPDTPAGKS